MPPEACPCSARISHEPLQKETGSPLPSQLTLPPTTFRLRTSSGRCGYEPSTRSLSFAACGITCAAKPRLARCPHPCHRSDRFPHRARRIIMRAAERFASSSRSRAPKPLHPHHRPHAHYCAPLTLSPGAAQPRLRGAAQAVGAESTRLAPWRDGCASCGQQRARVGS